MKKLLLASLLAICTCFLYAQNYSAWYSLEEMTLMGPANNYVEFLMKNSNAKFVDANGTITKGVNTIAAGSVVDATDQLWDLTVDPLRKVRVNDISKLDSISFRYLYVRNTGSNTLPGNIKVAVVDTLLVYWFNSNHLRRIGGSSIKFSLPGGKWDLFNLVPRDYFKVDTLLLSSKDSTAVLNQNGGYENGFALKRMRLNAPVGLVSDSTAQSKLIGFCLQFRSGVIGADTGYMVYQKQPSTLPAGAVRPNYFGYSTMVESYAGAWPELSNSFSGSMFVLKTSAQTMLSGLLGFFPGSGFNSKRIMQSDFYISSKKRNDNYTVAAAITHETCPGNADGALTLNGSGGTAPYMYAIDNKPFGTGAQFNNLPAGNYLIQVKDANNNIRVNHAHVWSSVEIVAGIIEGPSLVNRGNSASYFAAEQQTTPIYQWTVDGGTISSGQNTSAISVTWDQTIGTGSIRLIVTGSGCSDTSVLSVTRTFASGMGTSVVQTNKIRFYPVPASQELLFEQTKEETVVEIYDFLGRIALTGRIHPTNPRLEVAALKAGTYIIHLKSSEGLQVGKLLIE